MSSLESTILPVPLAEGTDNTKHHISLSSSLAQQNQQPARLPAVLTQRDLTMFMLLIVLLISNVNGVQFGGPATFLYWTLGLVTFLLPGAVVSRWLARLFPGQGAPYLWAAKVLGPQWSFFAAFCAWIPGVFTLVSFVETSFVFIQYLAPTWFVTPGQQCIAIILLLSIATAITCIPLCYLRHILVVFGVLCVSIYLLMGVTGLYWVWTRHAAATPLNTPASWQLNGNNFGVYGLILFALLGVDIPLFMGGEIRGGAAAMKRTSNYVWWGTALVFIAYIASTFGIMAVVPSAQAGGMNASVQTIQIAFGTYAGNGIALLLSISQVINTVAYILMFSRLLVIVAQDRRLPLSLTKLNRHGVPIVSIVAQGILSAFVAILAFFIVPALFGKLVSPADLALDVYNVLVASGSALWIVATAMLFFFVLSLLYTRRHQPIASKKQTLVLIGASSVGMIASLIGLWGTVSASWVPTLISDQRWIILISGVVLFTLIAGWLCSELPRVRAQLQEQQLLHEREIVLRDQLQQAYNEQETLIQQQQELLSEVDRLYREQAQAAVTDAITSLPNHRAIMSRLSEELSRCQRTQSSCAVLFVDLDHFKRINDSWGHRAGDMILREVAQRLREALRAEDFIGRYGGEEFAIILTEMDIVGVYKAAERLRMIIVSEPYSWSAENTTPAVHIDITASIGAAVYHLHGITREEMIEFADQAMYQAKHSGRNCVRVADVELEQSSANSSNIEEGGTSRPHFIPAQTVQALTAAACAHDQGTDEHAHRMVYLAEATARQLNFPEEQMHLVKLTALLHDIGKIGIPDAILHKPGPLTSEEWEVMRRHPQIGHQILAQVGGVFQHLAKIVVAHHERWDGHGYPQQLAGEDIPLGARIITVVDSFDAMTAPRVYRKKTFSVAEARAELLRCAGTQYDPNVVEAFLHVIDHLNEKHIEQAEPPAQTTAEKSPQRDQTLTRI